MPSVEEEINPQGLTATRITPADIKASILSVVYLNAFEAASRDNPAPPEQLKCLTLALVTMRNGFTIVGKSACASIENYDRELGERIAREDAERQVWPLLGFALREKLHEAAE